MPVLSLVSATIAPGRRDEVVERYRAAIAGELPPGARQTFLLAGDDDTMAIATVWESWEALDAVRSSGEEPLARRLLREAGAEPPEARFLEVVAERR